MVFCEVCYNDAPLVCTGCKLTRYCSAECQMADWKSGHKKACKIQQILNDAQKTLKVDPPARPPVGRCTGCNMKFSSTDRDYYCESSCEACGYQACESCACHSSRGTCYCPNANFGHPYCERVPAWYHGDGRTGKMYTGDRHPPNDFGDFPEDAYEKEPRKCGNCGKMANVLKPQYAQPR